MNDFRAFSINIFTITIKEHQNYSLAGLHFNQHDHVRTSP